MRKGWLLFWAAFFIGGGVNDVVHGNYGSAAFELVFGLGIGFHLIIRYIEE